MAITHGSLQMGVRETTQGRPCVDLDWNLNESNRFILDHILPTCTSRRRYNDVETYAAATQTHEWVNAVENSVFKVDVVLGLGS